MLGRKWQRIKQFSKFSLTHQVPKQSPLKILIPSTETCIQEKTVERREAQIFKADKRLQKASLKQPKKVKLKNISLVKLIVR